MNSKSFWNRATSLLLAVVMMVNMVPVEAFAAEWNNTILEAKRGEKVLFSQLVDEIVSDKSTNVKVTVTENVNGTNVGIIA